MPPMIDLHSHSIFSDGELIPSELARRARAAGLCALAITDHADMSNLDFIVPRIAAAAKALTAATDFTLICGVEITHAPPALIPGLIQKARDLGARVVVVHGETLVEPVPKGTNQAAIQGGADVLAHPGLITRDQVRLAAEKGVLLEISGRRGHCLSNGHVARLAEELGAQMVVNSDAHAPGDIMDRRRAVSVVLGAGLSMAHFERMQENARRCMDKV